MRRRIAVLVTIACCASANAADCVVFASSIAIKGPDEYAMAATISADIFPSIEQCNAALLQAWNSSLDVFSSQGMGVAESFALKCIVPRNCVPPDAGILTADERTIFPFVVERLR